MQVEPEAINYLSTDGTAVWIDARPSDEFGTGSLPGARNLQVADVVKAKDDGRLPSLDHNTRIIVFGTTGEQARVLAEEVAKNAFDNVAFFAGSFDRPRCAGSSALTRAKVNTACSEPAAGVATSRMTR